MLAELLQSFLAPLLTGGTVVAAVGYFGRTWFEHRLKRSEERFGAVVQARLEEMRSALAIAAHGQQVMLARVDGQRAAAISAVYEALIGWVAPLEQLIAGSPDPTADRGALFRYMRSTAESAIEAGVTLSNTLTKYAIYFDEITYERLRTTAYESTDLVRRFVQPIREAEALGIDVEASELDWGDELQSLGAHYDLLVKPVHDEVLRLFRKQLGVGTAVALIGDGAGG